MFFAFCYFILTTVLQIAPNTDMREREAEILVLRHQLAVLSRTNPRSRLRRRDRIVIAGLARLIPKARWTGFVVTPATILRWHRELVRHKWTFRHSRVGRPPLSPALVDLIIRMARENRAGALCASKASSKDSGIGWSDHDPHDPSPRGDPTHTQTGGTVLVGVLAVAGQGHPRLRLLHR
jgi:hypothetical protein